MSKYASDKLVNEVLEVLQSFQNENKDTPSLQQILSKVSAKNISSVHRAIKILVDRKWIETSGKKNSIIQYKVIKKDTSKDASKMLFKYIDAQIEEIKAFLQFANLNDRPKEVNEYLGCSEDKINQKKIELNIYEEIVTVYSVFKDSIKENKI